MPFTAARPRSRYSGSSDWSFISGVAESVGIPVFGSGDIVEAEDAIARLASTAVSGVLVGRGVLRNPWILAQAADLMAGRPARTVSPDERGRFLLEYIDLLLHDDAQEAAGFRHVASSQPGSNPSQADRIARGRDRWVINKVRALGSWYTKGFDNGSHLRTAINHCDSIAALRDLIFAFFIEPGERERLVNDQAAGVTTA